MSGLSNPQPARTAKCVCTTSCPEDPTENACQFCRGLDPYEPCPVIGFGCGAGCGCCTPEQQAAASREERAS